MTTLHSQTMDTFKHHHHIQPMPIQNIAVSCHLNFKDQGTYGVAYSVPGQLLVSKRFHHASHKYLVQICNSKKKLAAVKELISCSHREVDIMLKLGANDDEGRYAPSITSLRRDIHVLSNGVQLSMISRINMTHVGRSLRYWITQGYVLQPERLLSQGRDALEFLASINVYHCDVSINNVVYDRLSDRFRLIDFGNSLLTNDADNYFCLYDTELTTISYRDICAVMADSYEKRYVSYVYSDLYSLALVVAEIMGFPAPRSATDVSYADLENITDRSEYDASIDTVTKLCAHNAKLRGPMTVIEENLWNSINKDSRTVDWLNCEGTPLLDNAEYVFGNKTVTTLQILTSPIPELRRHADDCVEKEEVPRDFLPQVTTVLSDENFIVINAVVSPLRCVIGGVAFRKELLATNTVFVDWFIYQEFARFDHTLFVQKALTLAANKFNNGVVDLNKPVRLFIFTINDEERYRLKSTCTFPCMKKDKHGFIVTINVKHDERTSAGKIE